MDNFLLGGNNESRSYTCRNRAFNGGMLDTNSLYIAEELNKYGLEMKFKITVRDFRDEIYSAIDYCKKMWI